MADYNPTSPFTPQGGAPPPQQASQLPDLTSVLRWLKQHAQNANQSMLNGPTAFAGRAGGASGQMFGGNPQAPAPPTPQLPMPPPALTPPSMQQGIAPNPLANENTPRKSPLAKAIAQPSMQQPPPGQLPPQDQDEEGPNSPGPGMSAMPGADSARMPAPPPSLPSNPQLGGGGSPVPSGLMGAQLPTGQSPMTPPSQFTPPQQGGGDLMSIISRLLHLHGH